MTQALTQDQVQQLRKEFEADPRNRLLQNAVTRTTVGRRDRPRPPRRHEHRPLGLAPARRLGGDNQKKSGRCWLFAGTQPAAGGRRANARGQGLRVLAEPPAVLGQDREGQLLARGDHRRPPTATSTTAPSRTCSSDPGRGRRAVEHVRRPRRQARARAQGRDAGDEELVQHRADEPRSCSTILRQGRVTCGRCGRRASRTTAGAQGAAPRRRSTGSSASTSAPRRSRSSGSGPTRTAASTATAR